MPQGISEATYYLWKQQYSGVGVGELRELRQLREENGRLKRLVADLSVDRQILREIVSKKTVRPRARRKLALGARGLLNQQAARRKSGAARDQYTAISQPEDVRRSVAVARTGVGRNVCALRLSRLTVLLRREGWHLNAKRIYRLCREEELIVRTKQRRKIARRQRVRTSVATRANQCWSMDFVSDKFADGRSFRIFKVIDQFTCECVALEANRSTTAEKWPKCWNVPGRNEAACRKRSPWTMAASFPVVRWGLGPSPMT